MPSKNSPTILPGATLGIFGGGQLGRMFAIAAYRLGYQVHVFSPDKICPAGEIATVQTVADYSDQRAVSQFAQAVDVITLEFENIPTIALEIAARAKPVRPSQHVLHITQHRLREKQFLAQANIACTRFAPVSSTTELEQAIVEIGTPAVLKTCRSGYDGKGQVLVHSADQASNAWHLLDKQPAILEAFVDYQEELSVLVARSSSGEVACYPPITNHHVNHILDVSTFPRAEPDPQKAAHLAAMAAEISCTIAEQLEVVGLIGIEYFLTCDQNLLVNEIAPRTHNSGHLTLEACHCSQFEQQIRAICGLPLGNPTPISPAAMVNLLGDLWAAGEPNWAAALTAENVNLHLYGKKESRVGRKMGHLTALASTPSQAAQQAIAARAKLTQADQSV